VGISIYLSGVLLAVPRNSLGLNPLLLTFNEMLVWYSGVPSLFGLVLIGLDLWLLLPIRRSDRLVSFEPPKNHRLTVVLTAYNDEESIGLSVTDFVSHPLVSRVIVVENNSSDSTRQVAEAAGAIVVTEVRPGYGNCVFRALQEGISHLDSELTLLCEGDMTFRAFDIDKFMAYIPHAEIVNGTRIVEQLREQVTQLTTFMYYGNFAVAKLLEVKHLGRGTFTDVGTTYKLCTNHVLRRLLPLLNREINLEFNAHFLDVALQAGIKIVECPVTFFNRVGRSKGGNTNNIRAFSVGMRMIRGLLLGWPAARESLDHRRSMSAESARMRSKLSVGRSHGK
jgi:glycosyltransferase involved in cell wall biosynthesis